MGDASELVVSIARSWGDAEDSSLQFNESLLNALKAALVSTVADERRAAIHFIYMKELLQSTTQSDDESEQQWAFDTLARIIEIALHDKDSYTQRMGVLYLATPGTHVSEAMKKAKFALADMDAEVRCSSVALLGALAHLDSGALPILLDALRDADWTVRESAVEALGLISQSGKSQSSVAPRLIYSALHDRNVVVRRSAIIAIKSLAIDNLIILEQLCHAAQSKPVKVQCRALQALGRFVKDADRVIPILTQALNDSHFRVRATAARILAESMSCETSALPLLLQRCYDRNSKVSAAARTAVMEMQSHLDRELRELLFSLTQNDRTALENLRMALECHDWPEKTQREFLELCQRRLEWHKQFDSSLQDVPIDSVNAIFTSAQIVIDSAAQRSECKEHSPTEVERHRAKAAEKEGAWLIGKFLACVLRNSPSAPRRI